MDSQSRSILYQGLDETGDYDVFSVSANDSAAAVNLTPEAPGEPVGFTGHPNVSRDGRFFVYYHLGDVWLRRIDGSQPVQLTAGPRQDVQPEISPNGKRLTFQVTDSTRHDFDVYVMNLRPEGPDNPAVNLAAGRTDATGTSIKERFPSWSPDGSRITFQQHTD